MEAILTQPVLWIGLCGGLFVGVIIATLIRRSEPAKVDTDALESIKAEQEQYRREVSEHFAESAQLVSKMVESYRDVYLHLAEGSEKLADVDMERLGIEFHESNAVVAEQAADDVPADSAETEKNDEETAEKSPGKDAN